jgi:dehydrogenase/reductase SDR family member 4
VKLRVLLQEYGAISVLVLNAVANPTMGPLVDTPAAAIAKILDVNIKAALLFVGEASQHLASSASILFVSSIVAFRPSPPLSAYAVSKTALLGAVKALAAELGAHGIRVNGIAPGIVPTKFSAALVASEQLRQQQVRPCSHALRLWPPRRRHRLAHADRRDCAGPPRNPRGHRGSSRVPGFV